MNLARNSVTFHSARSIDCITKQTITWHLVPHHSGHYGSTMYTHSYLILKWLKDIMCSLILILRPGNEVWGKVMFSQLFVCPQGGVFVPACITGHMTRGVSVQGGLCLGGLCLGGLCLGVYVQGSLSGGLCPGGLCQAGRPPQTNPPLYGNECILVSKMLIQYMCLNG